MRGSPNGSTDCRATPTTSRRWGPRIGIGSGLSRRSPARSTTGGTRERLVDLGYSKNEIMIVASARLLGGVRNCFVGVGLPNIVCNLAQRTVAKDLQLVYESGVFGARPERLPLSIGDPTLATGSTAVTSMFELFAFYLQAGLIEVAFLGGAQIDRFGNLNTTVIGSTRSRRCACPARAARARSRSTPRLSRRSCDRRLARSSRRWTSGPRRGTRATPSTTRPEGGPGAVPPRWSPTWARTGSTTRRAR